jgi:hypothetical protein
MATATQAPQKSMVELVREMSDVDPKAALEIAIAETEKVKAMAAAAQQEYRAMAELEFDDAGRIVKANMAGLWRLARIYASSDIVPEHYRRKEADCFIACQMAFRCKVDPFAYMQNTYMVKGRPGLEAKLAVAMLNTSGKIKGRIRYKSEGSGKMRKTTAYAIDAQSGETVEGEVSWAMVEAEGWNQDKETRSGGVQKSKWNTMPDVMFHYRAASMLIKRHFPEVLMGMDFADEMEDVRDRPFEPFRTAAKSLDDFADELATAGQSTILNGNAGDTPAPGDSAEQSPSSEPSYAAASAVCAEPTGDTLFAKAPLGTEH